MEWTFKYSSVIIVLQLNPTKIENLSKKKILVNKKVYDIIWYGRLFNLFLLNFN